jgi:hypothetical protein
MVQCQRFMDGVSGIQSFRVKSEVGSDCDSYIESWMENDHVIDVDIAEITGKFESINDHLRFTIQHHLLPFARGGSTATKTSFNTDIR